MALLVGRDSCVGVGDDRIGRRVGGFERFERGARFTEATFGDHEVDDVGERADVETARNVERTGADRATGVGAGDAEAQLGVGGLVGESLSASFDELGRCAQREQL